MTNRVILALSISDIIFSTSCHIFGTWPVPQGLVYGSSGNQGTCTTQGFFNMFSAFCAALYNMTLALTYLLQVCYEWSKEKLRSYHPFFIFNRISFVLVIVTSITTCSTYNYNRGWACEISAYPLGCDAKDSGVDCICGSNTKNLFCLVLVYHLFLSTLSSSAA